MKKLLLHTCIAFSMAFASWFAMAQETSAGADAGKNTPVQANSETKAAAESSKPAISGALQVPRLEIRWGCQDCVNEKVGPLIEIAYAEEAARNGYTVSSSDTADVLITTFRQRPPAKRVMLGIFSGKDRLGVTITYREKRRDAEDYSANIMFGMNSLCDSVGKQTYQQVFSIMQAEKPVQ